MSRVQNSQLAKKNTFCCHHHDQVETEVIGPPIAAQERFHKASVISDGLPSNPVTGLQRSGKVFRLTHSTRGEEKGQTVASATNGPCSYSTTSILKHRMLSQTSHTS